VAQLYEAPRHWSGRSSSALLGLLLQLLLAALLLQQLRWWSAVRGTNDVSADSIPSRLRGTKRLVSLTTWSNLTACYCCMLA